MSGIPEESFSTCSSTDDPWVTFGALDESGVAHGALGDPTAAPGALDDAADLLTVSAPDDPAVALLDDPVV